MEYKTNRYHAELDFENEDEYQDFLNWLHPHEQHALDKIKGDEGKKGQARADDLGDELPES